MLEGGGAGVGAGAGGSDGAAAAADAGAGVGDGAAAGTARFVEGTLAEKKRPAPTHREERAKNYRKKRNTAKNTANKKRDAGAGARGTAQPKTAKLGTPRIRMTANSARYCVALTTR